MALISVTSSQIRKTKETLQSYNQSFKSQVTRLDESEQKLNTMWEGQANEQFHSAFSSDKSYMDGFYNLINQFCEALEQIATEYDKAESQNVETAKVRKY
ncbi:WXG100 family type VII secretion target [Brotaphodocola sp.]|uniref:WXG100 family type VII secretion target n=1 Tax=Brotaphodocola sp. TaxID=3073577 RepID=UPI003D7E2A4B